MLFNDLRTVIWVFLVDFDVFLLPVIAKRVLNPLL